MSCDLSPYERIAIKICPLSNQGFNLRIPRVGSILLEKKFKFTQAEILQDGTLYYKKPNIIKTKNLQHNEL
jgi:hypothetical protein